MEDINSDNIPMNQYMVTIRLPEEISEDFITAIPDQRELINNLLNMGIIISYSLSSTRRYIWTIIMAESIEEAGIIIDSFPIRDHITYNIDELLFYTNAAFEMPKTSLN